MRNRKSVKNRNQKSGAARPGFVRPEIKMLELVINECRCPYCADPLRVFAQVDSNIGLEVYGGACDRCELDVFLSIDNGQPMDVTIDRSSYVPPVEKAS